MRKITAGLLLFVMMISLCACTITEKAIVGTWKSQSSILGVVTETIYTFNEDGTGTKSNVLDVDFTYAFSDEKLLITTSVLGVASTEEFSYEFGWEKVVLTGEDNTIVLEKVK